MNYNAFQHKKVTGLVFTAACLLGSGPTLAHVNVGTLAQSGTATRVAQVICGSNENGATATYSFRIKGARVPLQVSVTSPNASPSPVAVQSRRPRIWSGWGASNGGNAAYTVTISKVGNRRLRTAFELEHHCSAANGGHTENEGFTWLK